MTFPPIVGSSFESINSQSNAINRDLGEQYRGYQNALAEANNRNLEMAFRSRDIQAQDARALANQDEEARRFALALANQAQDRADQISQARAASEYQNMAFKARQANDAALLQLERDKLAAMQSGKTDPEEQALMLSEHLGQLKEAADAAAAQTAANQQRIAAVKAQAERNGYKLVDDRRGNLTFVYNRQEPLAPGQVTADQLNGALADAMRQDKAAQAAALRAKQQFEKNLWNAKQFGVKQGMSISDEGITTKGGSQYRFAPGGSLAPSVTPTQPVIRINRSGEFQGANPETESGPSFTPAPSASMEQPSSGFVIPQQFRVPGFTPAPPSTPAPLTNDQIGRLLRGTSLGQETANPSDFKFPATFTMPGWTPPPPPRRQLSPDELLSVSANAAQNDPYGYSRSANFTLPQY